MKSDEPTRDLVEQALDNLVKQFANPMDFLRELVQNSIDAGSPRIEVELRFKGGDDGRGVAEIEVRDFGDDAEGNEDGAAAQVSQSSAAPCRSNVERPLRRGRRGGEPRR